MASYREKTNKENIDYLNGSTIKDDKVLLRLKQKYPINEKNEKTRNSLPIDILKKKYEYLFKENTKDSENLEGRSSNFNSQLMEEKPQVNSQSGIKLKECETEVIPRKVRLSNGFKIFCIFN